MTKKEDVPIPSDEHLAGTIRSFKSTQQDPYNQFLLDHIADRVEELVKTRT